MDMDLNEHDDVINYQQNKNRRININRPIIFICNDLYSKGLKELRSKAIVF